MNADAANKTFLFYDPHPLDLDATNPLPAGVRKETDALAGQILPLDEVLDWFRGSCPQGEFSLGGQAIYLTIGKKEGERCVWRVLRFREP